MSKSMGRVEGMNKVRDAIMQRLNSPSSETPGLKLRQPNKELDRKNLDKLQQQKEIASNFIKT